MSHTYTDIKAVLYNIVVCVLAAQQSLGTRTPQVEVTEVAAVMVAVEGKLYRWSFVPIALSLIAYFVDVVEGKLDCWSFVLIALSLMAGFVGVVEYKSTMACLEIMVLPCPSAFIRHSLSLHFMMIPLYLWKVLSFFH